MFCKQKKWRELALILRSLERSAVGSEIKILRASDRTVKFCFGFGLIFHLDNKIGLDWSRQWFSIFFAVDETHQPVLSKAFTCRTPTLEGHVICYCKSTQLDSTSSVDENAFLSDSEIESAVRPTNLWRSHAGCKQGRQCWQKLGAEKDGCR